LLALAYAIRDQNLSFPPRNSPHRQRQPIPPLTRSIAPHTFTPAKKESMRKTKITAVLLLCLSLGGVACYFVLRPSPPPIDIKFLYLTNNISTTSFGPDKNLAVFAVTNRADFPIQDAGFYYIESSGWASTYSPLSSAGTIPSHGSGTILTRIPTNQTPWRVIVPYTPDTKWNIVLETIRNTIDRKLNRASFDFDRYGRGATRSDWINDPIHVHP
jgi:hypothetical protein